jgi:hypothetical protein
VDAQSPSQGHEQFDRICEQVDEFDHLPAVNLPAPAAEPGEPANRTELNQLILAGLVSPA